MARIGILGLAAAALTAGVRSGFAAPLTGNDYIFHAKTDGTGRRSYLVRRHLEDGVEDFDFTQSGHNYATDMVIE